MEGPTVQTCCGLLRGSIKRSVEGFDYCAFKGIPYAKPPVGELRFQDPSPVEPWSNVRDATKLGSICAQLDFITNVINGSDDCLYLNVYVKSIERIGLPVMVWIHGGGFTTGSGSDIYYGPDYLLRKDIVLVCINYRLGVFGFLNLEDEVAPGNQGLKDQVFALKWVQDNISNFGGDPKNVTIFGESAGGASIHYLSISPLAKGLFHKAISQSGVCLNPWASSLENPKKSAVKLCSFLGKELEDPKDIVEFLRTVDCYKIVEAQQKMKTAKEKLQHVYAFGPGIDDKSSNPFLPVPLATAIKQGVQVPFLIGHNSREGIYFLLDKNEEFIQKVNENFEESLHPHVLGMLREHNLTANDLRQYYFGDEEISQKNIDKYVDMMTDMYFVEGVKRVAALQKENSTAPTYFYQFSYDKGFSLMKALIDPSMKGVSHTDELPFLFKTHIAENIFTIIQNATLRSLFLIGHRIIKALPGMFGMKQGTDAHKVMQQMTEMWVNFAASGNPTSETTALLPILWEKLPNDEKLHYLNIGEELRMEQTETWHQLFLAAMNSN